MPTIRFPFCDVIRVNNTRTTKKFEHAMPGKISPGFPYVREVPIFGFALTMSQAGHPITGYADFLFSPLIVIGAT